MKSNFFEKGITAAEVLIAISVLVILALITFPRLSDMRETQALKNAEEETVSMLHDAKSRSLASVNSSEYGVHFDPDKVIIFTGKTYNPNASDNVVTSLVSPASITNVTLGGVSSSSGDLYFERLTGIPSQAGSITISNSSSSKVVSISVTGAISVN